MILSLNKEMKIVKKLPVDIYAKIFNIYFDFVILELKENLSKYVDQYYVYTNEQIEDQNMRSIICWDPKYPHVQTHFNVYYLNRSNRHLVGIHNILQYKNQLIFKF